MEEKWYRQAVFYHIYPLGLLGAEKHNDYKKIHHRLPQLYEWIDHINSLGVSALYIGPLFESVGHGYETTDYLKTDSRLGDNADLKQLVQYCHNNDIKVIFDGVFNHTGRDFFAFKDLKENRENSKYKDWYCNVNFYNNNEYDDGFSYDNWGGYNLLVKLNQKNPEVIDYICDVIKFWVKEFDIDGIRLDAADVLDFDFMKSLRKTTDQLKDDFFLLGEVIHGEYSNWVNDTHLHSVTNYQLHKALYSGHNDHNFFEIAHTVNRFCDINKNYSLYNFVDNHDVERIVTKLNNKQHILSVFTLLFTLPGIPSIYYGSEFLQEGKKEKGSDDSLRPELKLSCIDFEKYKSFLAIVKKLAKQARENPAVSYGEYKQLHLTTGQYVFSRSFDSFKVIVALNNADNETTVNLNDVNGVFQSIFSGEEIIANGSFLIKLLPNSADVFVIKNENNSDITKSLEIKELKNILKDTDDEKEEKEKILPGENNELKNIPYENMTVEMLQQVIYEKMKKNGEVTDRMYQDIINNTHHGSLIIWAKSFNN